MVPSFLVEKENNSNFLFKLFIKAIPDIGFSFMYTLGLKYLNISRSNIYRLLLCNGIIGIILSLIIQVIFSLCPCPNIDYDFTNFRICDDDGRFITIIYNFKNFNNFGGFESIFIVLTNFLENIAIFLLIYYFSLNHFAAIFSIPTYFTFIIGDWNLELKIPYIIGGIIIILMALVYNEIIILRFCNLEKDTKIEIMKRSIKELQNKKIFNDNLEDDDDGDKEI